MFELPPSLLEVCYYSYFFTTYSTVYSYLCTLGEAEGHTCGSQLLSLVVDKTYLRSDLPSSDMPTDRQKLMTSNTVTDNRHRVTMQPKDASAYHISTKATARVAALDRIYANVPTCMMDQHTGHPYPYTRERHRSTGTPADFHHRRRQR